MAFGFLSKISPTILTLGFFTVAAVFLVGCKNSSVFTQWYPHPPEENAMTGNWTLLAGVSEQRAPMISFSLDSGTLVVVSIRSPDGVELAHREIVLPGVDEVVLVGQWHSINSFSVEIFDESSVSSSVGAGLLATLQIDL